MPTRHPIRPGFAFLALIACALIVPAQTHAADSKTATAKNPTDPATTTKKPPHLSPLATQGPKPEPITPPKPEQITSAINRGVKFLLADQRPDGSWGSPEHSKGLNIYAPAPGAHDAFRTAVTSLVIMAFIEAEPKLPKEQRTEVNKAIDRGAEWLDKHISKLRR